MIACRTERVHFIGIGGRAMGSLAVALRRGGDLVSGSDQGVYEPMRSWLAARDLQVHDAYAAANIPASADAVVVGMRIRADNPELQAAVSRGLPRWSFPAFLHHRYLTRSQNVVVAGGVGKTTTTAMLTWILEHAGRRPDYLIGGLAWNLEMSARFDGADLTILEGDEYASSFEDPRPKFLHYAPHVAVVTNLLSDHPDLYPDDAAMVPMFASLVALLPPQGCLILPAADRATAQLARAAKCRVVTVGLAPDADIRVENVRLEVTGATFTIEGVPFAVPAHGAMNVHNAAAAAVAARTLGVPWVDSAGALTGFLGVMARQDAYDAGGWTVVVDKATHPVSLGELSRALSQRYPGRRRICAVQPRATGGRNWVYQRDLPAALAHFDRVLLVPAYERAPQPGTPWAATPFCTDTLAAALKHLEVPMTRVPDIGSLPTAMQVAVEPGDVALLSVSEQFVGEMLSALGVSITDGAAATV